MGQQLLFDLPVRTAQGRADFIVTECNAAAVELIDRWPAWPGVAACIVGPARSGKTHLSRVWQQHSGATGLLGDQLTSERAGDLINERAIVIDNADTVADEEALFHLYNAMKNNGGHILLVACDAPGRWSLTLPDLRSRLATASLANLGPPDDALLKGLFIKLFQDYQTDVKDGVITFIINRIERSFAQVVEVAGQLNREAMRRKGPITIPLVRDVLGDG